MIRYLLISKGVIRFSFYSTEYELAIKIYEWALLYDKSTELLEVSYCSDSHQLVCMKVTDERIGKLCTL